MTKVMAARCTRSEPGTTTATPPARRARCPRRATRSRELDVAEGERTEGGGERQRHRLGEVGAPPAGWRRAWGTEDSRTIMSSPTPPWSSRRSSPPTMPMTTVATARTPRSCTTPLRACPRRGRGRSAAPWPPPPGAARHRGPARCRLGRGGVAQEVQQVGAEEGHGHRSEDHPSDQADVHGPLAHVDGGTDGTHQDGGDEVARDGRRRLHPEEQDEHGRHEGPTAGTGHPHEQPDDGAPEDDVRIDVHAVLPRRQRTRSAPPAGPTPALLS